VAINFRSASKRTGITIRTRTATAIYPENAPQNFVSFGADFIVAGSAGATLLTAPVSGKTWIVESLFVSTDAVNGAGVRVQFTGNLAVVFQSMVGAGALDGKQLIIAPFSVGNAALFGYTSTNIAGGPHFSISGVAYLATVPVSTTNAQAAQLIAVTQDGNPSADLG
jgi:hypothetical protein